MPEMMLAHELRRLWLSKLMAHRSLRRLATLLPVTAPHQAARMMSSRRAAPHHGSGCFTSPTKEAEYMAATDSPSPQTTQPCIEAGSIYDGERDSLAGKNQSTHRTVILSEAKDLIPPAFFIFEVDGFAKDSF